MGNLTSGTIKTDSVQRQQIHVDRIIFESCTLDQMRGMVAYFPPMPVSGAVIDVDLNLSPIENLTIKPGTFHFQLPSRAVLAQSWLCAKLMGEGGYERPLH